MPAGEDEEQPGMQCPKCSRKMPDLRGGELSVCRNCGYKDDCC